MHIIIILLNLCIHSRTNIIVKCHIILPVVIESLTPLIVEVQKENNFSHILVDAGSFGKVDICPNDFVITYNKYRLVNCILS